MITRILVVDDDVSFRGAIVRSLGMHDYEVVEAGDGSEAMSILELEKFDLILSDVKMPNLNGIELLHRVKRDYSDIPFIMMTGFSEVIEIKEAYDIGADGFLAKPYRETDLIDQIKKIETPEKATEVNSNFIGVVLDEFVAGASIKFPVYIKLNDNSFVKIANEGENLSAGQIQDFKNNGTKFFFLASNDFKLYIDFNLTIKPSILRSHTIPPLKKLKFLKILLNHHNKYMTFCSISEEQLEACLEIKNDILNILKNSKINLFEIRSLLCEDEYYVDVNSISCLLGLYINSRIEWKSEEMEKDILFGSLFQNISMKFSSENHGKEHTLESSKIIKQVDFFSEGFEDVILHHHEYLDGSGFPSGVTGSKVNTISNLINFSNYLVNQLSPDLDFEFINLDSMKGLFKNEFIDILKEEIKESLDSIA